MISPEVFLDLDNSLLNFSRVILEVYLEKNVNKIKYNTLLSELNNYFNKEVIDLMYISALDFLFLLGKLEYSVESDELELIR